MLPISLLVAGTQSLLVIRILRLLRIFRVFKMVRYVGEANVLLLAVRNSARKVAVFLGTVLTMVVIIGSARSLIERGTPGFENIPAAIYWAIVTLTTVGYGDVVPSTALGQILASSVMILGYGIIAVPNGIVTVELQAAYRRPVSTQACQACSKEGHDPDAAHCKYCGTAP